MATRMQKFKKRGARLAGQTARVARTAAVKGAVAGGRVAGAAVALTGLAVVAAAQQARKTVAKRRSRKVLTAAKEIAKTAAKAGLAAGGIAAANATVRELSRRTR